MLDMIFFVWYSNRGTKLKPPLFNISSILMAKGTQNDSNIYMHKKCFEARLFLAIGCKKGMHAYNPAIMVRTKDGTHHGQLY